MCGICGICGFSDRKLVLDMNRLITHRGPDEEAYYYDDHISLGMRRLSIIDLKKGIYPLHNEDDSIQMVFNGEIYNFQELRPELEKKGHKFRTNNDGEVMVHLYEEHGLDFVKYLRGMFAVALYDSARKKLILVRDRLGLKPLYYYYEKTNGRLVFCSEIKSILKYEGYKKEVNLQSMYHYLLYRYVPGPQTLFRGILSLPPAHILMFDLKKGTLSTEQYWDLREDIDYSKSESYYVKEFERLFNESVKLRMIADVPIGVLLSGGLDSACIMAMMKRTTDSPIKTFTAGFSDVNDTDLVLARKLAEHFGTDHQEVFMKKEDVYKLPQIVWFLDQPTGSEIVIPMRLLSQAAGKNLKVVLTGDGGDEIFAGYVHQKTIKAGTYYRSLVPKVIRKTIVNPSIRMAPISFLNLFFQYPLPLGNKGKEKFMEFMHSIDSDPKRYFSLVHVFNRKDINDALSQKCKGNIVFDSDKLNEDAAILEDRGKISDPINRVLMVEIKTWLPDLVLFNLDKILMSSSVENRAPFIDHRLVEFSMRVPPKYKLKGLGDKYLVRKAMKDYIPKISQHKKRAFVVPINEYFKEGFSHLIDEHLSDDAVRERGLFNMDYIRKLLEEKNRNEVIYNRQLMNLLIFEIWMKIYFDNNGKFPSIK